MLFLPNVVGLVALGGSVSTAHVLRNAQLLKRADEAVCSGLTAPTNNGDRKMAIVIDSSSSMQSSDPTDLRLDAGKSFLDWLYMKNETSDTHKEDAVTVIDFSDEATLDYKLGDPANAYEPLAGIIAYGGTYIASGVKMAIEQLTADGTGDTKDRSGILVFTDGSDLYTAELVDEINSATDKGIRVSFGFLGYGSSYQDADVLRAIMHSGGRYFTVSDASNSRTFVNGILVNGLTKNDNPTGDESILLAGLEGAHFIAGSETQTMTYGARAKEELTITIRSVDAGTVDAEIKSGKKTLASQKGIYFTETMFVTAPSDGNIDVKVTAKNAPKDSIFIVGVDSNLPPENCTVGVGPKPGGKKNNAIIIGPTVGVGLAVILGGCSYFLWKYFHSKTPATGSPDVPYHGGEKGGPEVNTMAVPPVPPTKPGNWFKDMFKFPDHAPPVVPPPPTTMSNAPPQDKHGNDGKDMDDEEMSEWEDARDMDDQPSDPNDPNAPPAEDPHKKYHRIHRVRIYGNNHHHHIAPDHPCWYDECPLVASDHVCDDSNHPCTCVDPKCKLNSRLHRCKKDDAPPHKCFGPKEDPNCPLNDPPYMEAKKKEHNELVRKYMMQDAAKSGLKMGATYTIRVLGGV
ncbi:hypothetical protein K458DRAFT_339512 [Lentithecium fluviatile CBS 122367]|uniref:VWFA domain-containing protein n=1 Tax=Lentithecium fluviatile CBS 122367 TaxID=1168545 RepID=A0A6G1J276_9PLEO|nr:hypothetical protein K458DRAFT_339512 [Lentithecium fluviatile CBS 122367]